MNQSRPQLECDTPNKRINLTRRSEGGVSCGRRARRLSAVRWAHDHFSVASWGQP
jgi:hypothetical protein